MPHRNSKDDVARENEGLDAHTRKDLHDKRRQGHDDECARTKNESGVRSGVAIEALEHLGDKYRRSEQSKAKKEVVKVRNGEVPVCKQTNLDHRVGMAPLPKRGCNQRRERDRKKQNDETAL